MAIQNSDRQGQVAVAGANQVVLQQFWQLASDDQAERSAAAEVLVAELLAGQQQHVRDGSSAATAAPMDADEDEGADAAAPGAANRQEQLKHALKDCSPLMVYSLRRLARGLASGRGGARQGFGAALAVLLAKCECVSADGVLVLLEACLEVSGSMTGSEQREALLGRVFGLAALVRSGITQSPAAVTMVAEQLVALGQRKNFLREATGAVLAELLGGARDDALAHALAHGKRLGQLLYATQDDASPEGLLLALRLWHRLPPEALSRCKLLPHNAPPPPPSFWDNPDSVPRSAVDPSAAAVLSVGHLTSLLPLLLASSASHPRLHQVWGCLLALLLPGFRPTKDAATAATATAAGVSDATAKPSPDPSQLKAFWGTVVEGALFGSASHERKHLGLTLFQLVLPHLGADTAQDVLSGQFLRCVGNSMKDKQSYLHVSAKRCTDRLVFFAERRAASGDTDTPLAIAATLQRCSGGGFDALSKTKTTSRLLQALDAKGVDAYVAKLMRDFEHQEEAHDPMQVEEEEESEGEAGDLSADSKRRWIVEQLGAAARFPAATEATAERALRFLSLHAFMEVQPQAAPASTVSSTSSAKKGKQKKGAGQKDGAADETVELLVAAGRCSPAPSREVRELCAARLVGLLAALGRPQQEQQGQQAGSSGRDAAAEAGKEEQESGGAGGDGQPPAKRARKQAQADAPPPQLLAAQRRDAASALQDRLLSEVLGFVARVQASPGVSLALELPDEVQTALDVLREVDAALAATAAATAGDGATMGSGDDGPGGRLARLRALLQVVRLLQLQLLSDPLGFDAAVAMDVRRVAVRGMGVELEEQEESEDEFDEEEEEDEGEEAGAASGSQQQPWMDVLLDVLLSLLAQPAGTVPLTPLREACEQLFKSCVTELTATGLADLLRVVGQRADEGEVLGDAEAGEKEEEEEEEEQEEEGSDAEDSDASDDEEEAVADEGGAGASGRAANGNGAGATTAAAGEDGSDDGSDDDGSDFDDDAMDRMDARLGSVLRTLVQGKGRTGAKERSTALLNLKFRALALLEEWVKRVPNSPLLLDAVAPLLRAASQAARSYDSPALSERLRGMVASKLAKAKPALGDAAPEALAGALRKALYYASRDGDQKVAAAAAQLLLGLLTSATAAGGAAAQAAADTTAAAVSDFLAKKKSRLGRGLLEDVASRCPGAVVGGAAFDGLLAACCTARTEFMQAEALQVLAALFKTAPQHRPAVAAALSTHSAAFGAALSHAVTGPFKTKERHVAAVKAAGSCIEGARKLSGQGKRLVEVLGPDGLNGLAKGVLTVREAGVPPKVDAALTRLVAVAGLEELLARTKPDPARLAALRKQRLALEPPAAPGGAAAGVAGGGAEGGEKAAKHKQKRPVDKQQAGKLQQGAKKQGGKQRQGDRQQDQHSKKQKQGKQQQGKQPQGKQPQKKRRQESNGDQGRAAKAAKAGQASPAQQ